jgi:TetR/AcrR family transcriptional repressor of nem operon
MSSSPGRPRSFVTEDALDAALELFWKNGYRVTTARDLEESLGLNASSIYNAFGSKEALLVEALGRYESRITGALIEPLERSDEGIAAIEAFFVALGEWVTHDGRRGCMLVNMMAEDAGATKAISKRVRAYGARLRNAFSRALERAMQAGELVPDDIEPRTDLLMCQVFGLNIAARGGSSVAELSRLVSAVQRQIAEWNKKGEV